MGTSGSPLSLSPRPEPLAPLGGDDVAALAALGARHGHATVLAAVVLESSAALSGAPAEPLALVAPRLALLLEGEGSAAGELEARVERARGDARRARWRPSPALPGRLREALLDDRARRLGSHYTPAHAVRALLDLVFDGVRIDGAAGTEVCDPACGGGAFLLAAADVLAERGVAPHDVVEGCLWGCDLDPLAVAVTEAALVLWAAERGVVAAPGEHLVTADGLRLEPGAWPGAPDGFRFVVGNPPFQSQLSRDTARAAGVSLPSALDALRDAYTDTAALFLAQAVRLARSGGRIALLQPLSFLSARDTAKVRAWLSRHTEQVGLWLPEEQIFAASVRVSAPILERREAHTGSDRAVAPSADVALSRVAARTLAIPSVELADRRTIADVATATAGFRDQFYGLAPHVAEAPAGDLGGGWLPLVTSGLIDPVHNRWGTATARFAGRSFERPALPVAALPALPSTLAGWVVARTVPKLLLATQTRTLEAIVDEHGSLVPSVPTIAVHAAPAQLWLVAAAISAPPVTAWAAARTVGASRSVGAIKLAARQVLGLPLPTEQRLWQEAAALLAEAAAAAARGDGGRWHELLFAFGARATAAYRVDPDGPVLAWWSARLPRWR